MRWLREAAENGHDGAQAHLGLFYLRSDGAPLDLKEGFNWLKRSAESGHAFGQAVYGWGLLSGKWVEKNPVEAVEWFKQSAEQGDAYAQCCLGHCLMYGIGIEKDYERARKWLKLASEQGDADARYYLRHLWFQEHLVFKWRYAIASSVGTAFLIFHATRNPIVVSASAIFAFTAILLATAVLFVGVLMVLDKFGIGTSDKNDSTAVIDRMGGMFKKEPWRLLLIPGENGFCLLPLLYVGINAGTAAIAAIFFAVMHYPSFPWRHCVPKGVAYFFVAMLVLPTGIWSIVVAHVAADMIFIGIVLCISRRESLR